MGRSQHLLFRAPLGTWLMGCALSLTLLLAWGQDMATTPSAQPMTEEPHHSLQELKRRIGQLHRSTEQASLSQKKQGQALEQQVVDIEHSLNSLGKQLTQLQAHSLLQLQDLKAANRLLRMAVWALAILASLVLGVLLWLWRRRQAVQPPPIEPKISPQPSTIAMAAPMVSPEAAENLSTAADTVSAVSQPPYPVVTEPPQAALSATWSDLLGTQQHNTQNALARARQGFMRLPHSPT